MFAQMFGQQASAFVSATGGIITNYTEGIISYRAHIFTNSGTFTVTSGGAVEALIVGAGGMGGPNCRAGGGGGQVVTTNLTATAGSLSVVVAPTCVDWGGNNATATVAYTSSFFGVPARGGNSGNVNASTSLYALGGRNSSGVLNNSPVAQNGGDGTTCAYSGLLTYYGGGGGGGGDANSTTWSGVYGLGGLGGGGTGGAFGHNPTSGADNTGGGGGGAGGSLSSSADFRYGGSGIVIIRYRTN